MTHLRYWLAANLIGLSTQTLLKLLEIIGEISNLFTMTLAEYQEIGFTPAQIKRLLNPDWRAIDSELAWLESSKDHHILIYASSLYPEQLKKIADPPLLLYVKGELAILRKRQLAIVGSRNPSNEGRNIAFEFANLLSENFIITSGLAKGIDSSAHQGTLAAQRQTIAVFGTGLSHVYPMQNRKLANDILEARGALLSEFPLHYPPRAIHFPMRNRIISGLSLGVLVVEAAIKSGSLVTARLAINQGREVFAVPGSIKSPFTKGCHLLIKQGANLVDQIDDIYSILYIKKAETNKKEEANENISSLPLDLSPEEHHILSLITSVWISFDQLLLLSRLTIGELSSMLLSLELRNLIQSQAGGYKRSE